MTRAPVLPTLLLVVLPFACGPSIEPPQADTGSSSDGSEGPVVTTTPPPPTSTSTSTSTTTSTTTATTTTSDDDDDSSDDTSGVLFLIPPDGGVCGAPGTEHWRCSECDMFAQDCPRGEKCMPWANDGGDAWNASRCSPIAPLPGQPGDECHVEGSGFSGIDDCDLGVVCWNVDPATDAGTCVGMCTGDEANPQCREGARCLIANDGSVVLCLPSCDPLAMDVCPANQTCTAVNEDPVCIPSVGIDVLPCGVAVCSPGEACLDSGVLQACMESECCTPWCDWTAADPDAPCAAEPGHSCQPYYEPGAAPAGLEHLGACRLPL